MDADCHEIDDQLYFCKGKNNGCNNSGDIIGSNPFKLNGNHCTEANFLGLNHDAIIL